jgi:hypothetical protein
MKLQRWSLYRGSLEPTTNGGWVKYEDADALELAVERATANMVAAQNRVAELEKALTDKIEERPVHKSSFDYEAEGKV